MIDTKKVPQDSIGTWHHTRHYDYITVTGTITGCGLAQMYGVVNLCNMSKKSALKLLEAIKSDYRRDGAGGIVATLGAGYYNYEKQLLDFGFVMLKEYENYRHGSGYKQRLYILTY